MKKRPPYLKKLDLSIRRQYDLLNKRFKDQTFLTGDKFKIAYNDWEILKHNVIFMYLWLLQDHQNELREIQRCLNAGRVDIVMHQLEKRLK